MGRPSNYSQEMAERICDLLSEGESLLKICQRKEMPAQRTVYVWLEKEPNFVQMYTRAREIQGHVRAEMATEAALTASDAQLGRLKYDALKWHAAKLVPRVYGDRQNVEHSGPDNSPIQFVMYGTPEAKDADEWQSANKSE